MSFAKSSTIACFATCLMVMIATSCTGGLFGGENSKDFASGSRAGKNPGNPLNGGKGTATAGASDANDGGPDSDGNDGNDNGQPDSGGNDANGKGTVDSNDGNDNGQPDSGPDSNGGPDSDDGNSNGGDTDDGKTESGDDTNGGDDTLTGDDGSSATTLSSDLHITGVLGDDECEDGKVTLKVESFINGKLKGSGQVKCPEAGQTVTLPKLCRKSRDTCLKVTIIAKKTQDTWANQLGCVFIQGNKTPSVQVDFDSNGAGFIGGCSAGEDDAVRFECDTKSINLKSC